MRVSDFALAVRAYAREMGASVTSWGRTTKRNRDVGGVPNSHHLTWLACDVVYDDTPDLELAQHRAARHGLRLIREATHDHLQVA